MSCRDAQQRQCRSFRPSSSLLPVAQGMNAYFQRSCEFRLSQSHKGPKRCNVLSRLEMSLHESLSEAGGNRAPELFVSQVRNVAHLNRSICAWSRPCLRNLRQKSELERKPPINQHPATRHPALVVHPERHLDSASSLPIEPWQRGAQETPPLSPRHRFSALLRR